MSAKKFKIGKLDLTPEERWQRKMELEVRDAELERRALEYRQLDRWGRDRIYRLMMVLAALTVVTPVYDVLKKWVVEEIIFPIEHRDLVEKIMTEKIANLDKEKAERDLIQSRVQEKIKEMLAGHKVENLSSEQRALFEKQQREVEQLLKERERNKIGKELERDNFIGDLYVDMEREKPHRSFVESFLKIDYLIQGYSQLDYEKSERKWANKRIELKRKAEGMKLNQKLALLVREFIPKAQVPTIRTGLIDAVNHNFDPEYTTCFSYTQAVIGGAEEIFPDSTNDLYFQFFGDHVRAVILIENQAYALDANGVGFFDDELTKNYDNRLIRARDWLAILSGHDKEQIKITESKGEKNDHKDYLRVTDNQLFSMVDLGQGMSPTVASDTWYGEAEFRMGKGDAKVNGDVVAINASKIDASTVKEIKKLDKKLIPRELQFRRTRNIEANSFDQIVESLDKNQLKLKLVSFPDLTELTEEAAKSIAKLKATGIVFGKLRRLEPKVAKALFGGEHFREYYFSGLDELNVEEARQMVGGKEPAQWEYLDVDLENSDFTMPRNEPKKPELANGKKIEVLFIDAKNMVIEPEVMRVLADFDGESLQFMNLKLSKEHGVAFRGFKKHLDVDPADVEIDGFLEGVVGADFLLSLYPSKVEGGFLNHLNAFTGKVSFAVDNHLAFPVKDGFKEAQLKQIGLAEFSVQDYRVNRSRIMGEFMEAVKNYPGEIVFPVDFISWVSVDMLRPLADSKAKKMSLIQSGVLDEKQIQALAKFPREIVINMNSYSWDMRLHYFKGRVGDLTFNFPNRWMDHDVVEKIVNLASPNCRIKILGKVMGRNSARLIAKTNRIDSGVITVSDNLLPYITNPEDDSLDWTFGEKGGFPENF